jgi:hypothetical protein
MSKGKPSWLPQAREYCRSVGIEVCAWGPDTLVVKTSSRDHAGQAACQLSSLGFQPIEDEDDATAGLLTLARVPAVTSDQQKRDQTGSADIFRLPSRERITATVLGSLGACAISFAVAGTLISSAFRAAGSWVGLCLWGAVMFFAAVGSGWGWRLQITPTDLRIRRWLRCSAIPWAQIHSIQMGKALRSRGGLRSRITLVLVSGSTLNLGTLPGPFACVLRDRLQDELRQRLK